MSMRHSDRQQATASAATPAMIVLGRRSANTMGLKEDCMEGNLAAGGRILDVSAKAPPVPRRWACRRRAANDTATNTYEITGRDGTAT